jgi:rare lipoprotein A
MGRLLSALAILIAGASLAACGTTATRYEPRVATTRAPPAAAGEVGKVGRPYEINGRWYTPRHEPDYDETGLASWYGGAHQGRPTAMGEPFDMNALSAAHKTLPLPSLVEVTNLDNGKRIVLRVNDRGPFVDGRIIDLSRAAAEELGMLQKGVARVRVRYVGGAATASAKPAGAKASGGAYEVQAGLFSQRENAERAAGMIASAGRAEIRPVQQDSGLMWRVVVGRLGDEREANAVRRRVVESGFTDARVVGPF